MHYFCQIFQHSRNPAGQKLLRISIIKTSDVKKKFGCYSMSLYGRKRYTPDLLRKKLTGMYVYIYIYIYIYIPVH